MTEENAVSTPSEEEKAGEGNSVKTLDEIIDAAMSPPEPEPEPDAKTEPEAEKEAPSEDEPEPEPSTEEEPSEPEAVAEDDKVPPPEDWPSEQKDVFSKLGKDAQQMVLTQYKNMQAGHTRKMQELAGKRKLAEEIESRFAPYAEMMRQTGKSPVDAIDHFLGLDKLSRENPVAFMQQMAHNLNVDLSKLGSSATPNAADQSAVPPGFELLVQRGIDARVKPLEQEIRQREQQENEKLVLAFRDAKGPEGKLEHPHFDKVADRIAELLRSRACTTIDNAYKIAVREDDELYKAEIETERKAMVEQEVKRREEAVAKAKRAGKPVAKATPPSTRKVNGSSLDEILDRALEKL